MPIKANQIDLSLLPPSSRREVRDFYQFLLERHSRSKSSQLPAKRKFADLCGQLSWKGNAVAAQRSLRDEW